MYHTLHNDVYELQNQYTEETIHTKHVSFHKQNFLLIRNIFVEYVHLEGMASKDEAPITNEKSHEAAKNQLCGIIDLLKTV